MQGSFPVPGGRETSFQSEMGNSGLTLIAQLVKNPPAIAGDPGWIPGSGRSPGEGMGYPPMFWGFPCSSAGKESACNAGHLGSIPGLERLPTPVFWPEEFHGLYSPWVRKELDRTEQLSHKAT